MGLYNFQPRFVPGGDEISRQIGRQICQKLYPVLGTCEHPLCLEPAVDRHHRDENPLNNKRSNVQFLCRRHHAETHRPIANFILSRPSRRYTFPEIEQLFRGGMTIKELAAYHDCSTQPIRDALRKLGLNRPAAPRPGVMCGAANPAWKGGRQYKPVLVKTIPFPGGPNKCRRGPCALCSSPFLGRGRQKVCNTCMETQSYEAWKRNQQSLARRRFEERHGHI
jgi:hypothetical protein